MFTSGYLHTHLYSLDPLGKQQRTSGFGDGTRVWVYRAYDGDACIAGEGRLEHPRQLGVTEGDMVAVVSRISKGVLISLYEPTFYFWQRSLQALRLQILESTDLHVHALDLRSQMRAEV